MFKNCETSIYVKILLVKLILSDTAKYADALCALEERLKTIVLADLTFAESEAIDPKAEICMDEAESYLESKADVFSHQAQSETLVTD